MEPFSILIVDDDQLWIDHLTRMLQKQPSKLAGRVDRPFAIRTAATQQEAEQALAKAPPRGYDLIILDREYRRTPEDNKEFLGERWLPDLRKAQPNSTIAIATAYASERFMGVAVEALADNGADEFIPKLVSDEEIVNRLAKAIDRRRAKSQVRKPHQSNVLRVSAEDLNLAFSKASARLRSLGAGAGVEGLFRDLQENVERISGRFQGPPAPEEKDLKEVDLLRVINEELPLFECQLPGCLIRLETDGNHRARTYETDFRDALREVLQNAVDAVAEAGSQIPVPITVAIRRSEDPVFRDVCVTDMGSDFMDEAVEKMFQPGCSLWKHDGSRHKGMGLYVAQRMMRALGGDIGYEKPSSGGATIILSVRDWSPQ
jgi:CheY-like chemotaxis protein